MTTIQTKLLGKLKESLSAVLPIMGIVLILSFTIAPLPSGVLLLFLFGGFLLIIGMMFFNLSAEMAMTPFLFVFYLIVFALAFLVPDDFLAIAFDSGGVASGPMTATFLLPFAMGACETLGGNIVQDAFGIVAMVAMTPLIAIQLMGLIYQIKAARIGKGAAVETPAFFTGKPAR